MKYNIAISGLLALSVIFQAAQPLSVFAQEASVDSQKAAQKKIPKKPTRIFSAMPSLEPETPEAKELAKAMQQSVRERLTPITLAKFELKSVKPAPSVSADTKFTINEMAADGSLALGYASVPGGDAFAVFLKQTNGVVGIVETLQRLVGNKKIDLERAAQLQAVGFKVSSLVDRYQVVHWNFLDPKGIPETVAKQPTFVTKSLTPEQLHNVIFPKVRQKKATGASVAAVTPAVVIGAVAAAVLNAPGVFRRYDTPKYDCDCFFENYVDNICPVNFTPKNCSYKHLPDSIGKIQFPGKKGEFYSSPGDCDEDSRVIARDLCEAHCKTFKGNPAQKKIQCIKPVLDTPTGENDNQVMEVECPKSDTRPVLDKIGSCKTSSQKIACPNLKNAFTTKSKASVPIDLEGNTMKDVLGRNIRDVKCTCTAEARIKKCDDTDIACNWNEQVKVSEHRQPIDYTGSQASWIEHTCKEDCSLLLQYPQSISVDCGD